MLKAQQEDEHFPTWLTVESKFNSLDDVFETIMNDDFDETLTKYLDNMPRNREAAEEILEEMTQWDDWKLYKVLLQEYINFLTQDEIAKTIRAYKKIFSIPLSSIMDESDFKVIDEEIAED